MFRKIIGFGFLILLTFFSINEPHAFEKAYVTDLLKITLRTGPSIENKIIAFLDSGHVLEVIETQGDWSRVRVSEEDGAAKEGWVLSQYLTDQKPYKLRVRSLMDENRRLKNELGPVKRQLEASLNQKERLSMELEESEAKLSNLQKEFASLKRDAAGYLKLKSEYEKAKSKLNDLDKRNEILEAENKRLREAQKRKWFFAGALVLFSGLVLGLVLGRQKKRKSSYY